MTPLLQQLLDEIERMLRLRLPDLGLVVQSPGSTVAWDDCCSGMGYVTVRSVSAAPPNGPCGPIVWVATLDVGVLRCAAVLDDSGRPPAEGEITADSGQAIADMHTLAGLLACVEVRGVKPAMELWNPLGVDGGCAGGAWTCRAIMPAATDCSDCSEGV